MSCIKKVENGSSAEVEYRTMAFTMAELTCLTYLLRDLEIHLLDPPILVCNNTSSLHMAESSLSCSH